MQNLATKKNGKENPNDEVLPAVRASDEPVAKKVPLLLRRLMDDRI